MKNYMYILIACGLCAGIGLGTASADPYNVRPVPVSDSSLQDALNGMTISGPGVNVLNDQTPYAVFSSDASGGSVATMMIEITPFADGNRFGIYEYGNPGNKAMIFDGADSPGAQALVGFGAGGNIFVNGAPVALFSDPYRFGFYLDVFSVDGRPAGVNDILGYTVYTEDSLNLNQARALVFGGDDQTIMQLPTWAPGTFTDDEFIIAFDDGFDGNFSDMVVMVESITPIPAPAAVVLGMIGLGLVARIRKFFV